MKLSTAILHFPPDPVSGSPLPPVAQVSAFTHPSAEHLERVFQGKAPGFAYTRLANPTIAAFEQRIAALEGGLGAVACASGMAAVAMALLNILQTGDEFVATSRLYGGTLTLFHDLTHLGITPRFAADCTPEAIEPLLNDRTRLIFTEAISNPGLDVADIAALSRLAHRHSLPLIVDSTTATPALLRPLLLGADVVVHSSSKYINGSGDAISGVIVDGGRFPWSGDRWPVLAPYCTPPALAFTKRLRQDLWQNFGPCLAPQNAFLNVLGLETLALRMERECENALKLARALEHVPGIRQVGYPGLEHSPCHALVQRQMENGMAGALLTLRLGSRARAFAFLNELRCVCITSNIGDVRTLAIHPASSIFLHSDPREQERAGVYPDLVRVSVGIEDIGDLIEDFTRAAGAISGME